MIIENEAQTVNVLPKRDVARNNAALGPTVKQG
jgi:hypothetical protein